MIDSPAVRSPSSTFRFDRMCFLFTMSDTEDRGRTTENRRSLIGPAHAFPNVQRTRRILSKTFPQRSTKLILHRTLACEG
jgi:hypothetical protein